MFQQFKFSIIALMFVFILISLNAETDKKRNNFSTDIILTAVLDTAKLIKKNINGQEVDILLNGSYEKTIEFEGHEYPLKLWEAHPNVLYIQKYFEEYRYNSHENKNYRFERPVMDEIVFFDNANNLIYTYNVDDNNPYLHSLNDAIVRSYFSDTEHTFYSSGYDMSDNEKIIEYHLNTAVEQQGQFTRVLYHVQPVSNKGAVIQPKTTVIVIDKAGEAIFEEEFAGLISLPAISNNGKYLVVTNFPIETNLNSGIKTQKDGFSVWDVTKHTQIYKEENDDPDMWIEAPYLGVESGFLVVDYTYPNSKVLADKVYLFDPTSRTLYSRIRTKEERNELSMNWLRKYKNNYLNVINDFPYNVQKF